MNIRKFLLLLLTLCSTADVFSFDMNSMLGAKRPPKQSMMYGDRFHDRVTGMDFVYITGGCYTMGNPNENGWREEKPTHEVCIDGFYMGKYEVTNAQMLRIFPEHDSGELYGLSLRGDEYPAVNISWHKAKEFVRRLSVKTGRKFRLPTEAEWEYAARGGTVGELYRTEKGGEACLYENLLDLSAKEHFGVGLYECSDGYVVTSPAGVFPPNGIGLYDMKGNVWEWVEDAFSPIAYSRHGINNPKYIGGNDQKVRRGGSFDSGFNHDYVYTRNWILSVMANGSTGFRVVFQAE